MREGQKKHVAQALRRNATEGEKIMWHLLRDRRLAGVKFRRQVPIGPFVADFASVQHRLVIEVDGSQHIESSRDERRDAYLAASGWRVLHFWNNDLMADADLVLDRVVHVVTAPHPASLRSATLSRKRERD